MRLFILLITLISISTVASAQLSQAGSSSASIEITSDNLEIHQQQQKAIFSGNVHAQQEGTSLYADQMIVLYRNQESGNSNKIKRIDVKGNVKLATPGEQATSNSGTYFVDEKQLSKDKNLLKGKELEYNLVTGKSRLIGGDTNTGRVKGVFLPGN
jgi:lipopolysaccharide export system protein LptA